MIILTRITKKPDEMNCNFLQELRDVVAIGAAPGQAGSVPQLSAVRPHGRVPIRPVEVDPGGHRNVQLVPRGGGTKILRPYMQEVPTLFRFRCCGGRMIRDTTLKDMFDWKVIGRPWNCGESWFGIARWCLQTRHRHEQLSTH